MKSTVADFLKTRTPTQEVEIRLGKIRGKHFKPGVPLRQFGEILEYMQTKHESKKHTNTVDFSKGAYRFTVQGTQETMIQKKRLRNEEFYGANGPFDVRVSLSSEESEPFLEETKRDIISEPSMVREKDRMSYLFEGFQIDLTVATVHVDRNFRAADIDEENTKVHYEVEIEITDPLKVNDALAWVYTFNNLLEPGDLPSWKKV